MAKKIDHAKAKAKKQKKIAIAMSVLLLVVLAVQGPRTLKMLKGPAVPEAAPVPTPVSPAGSTEAVVPPLGAPVVGAGSPASSAEPAVLASSDQPVAGPGQLLSFELFTSKDPFVQQVRTGSPAAALEPGYNAAGDPIAAAPPVAASAPAAAKIGALAEAASSGGSAVPRAVPPVPAPTPAPSQPAAPAAAPATATTISINGVSGPAEVDKQFPPEDPIFVLVSTAPDGKSVEIGIAGGQYANGEDTIKLKVGKPLTLQNTADGSRYELLLQSVAGFVPPATKR